MWLHVPSPQKCWFRLQPELKKGGSCSTWCWELNSSLGVLLNHLKPGGFLRSFPAQPALPRPPTLSLCHCSGPRLHWSFDIKYAYTILKSRNWKWKAAFIFLRRLNSLRMTSSCTHFPVNHVMSLFYVCENIQCKYTLLSHALLCH